MVRTAVAWGELVHAIQASPDDDTPRLVAADWLLERGEVRGEHVALQVEVARRGEVPEVTARLAAIDPTTWLAPLVVLGACSGGSASAGALRLVRGFVDFAALVGRDVANTGPLLRREPITRLDLASGGDGPSSLAASAPELGRLRSLRLSGRYTSGHRFVMRSPHLAELHTLYADELLEAQLAALADTAMRPHRLAMSPRPAAARALAESHLFDRLEQLDANVLSDDASLVEIARHPLAALRGLSVTGWDVGPRGLQALGARIGQLETLRHQGRLLDVETVGLIARHAGRLRELELPYVAVDLDATLDSGAFDHLVRLALPGARYSRPALLRFLARTHMPRTPAYPRRALATLSNDQLTDVFPGLDLTPDEP